MARLRLHDMGGEFEHILGDLLTGDVVEIFLFLANLVWVTQCDSEQPLPRASNAMMCSRDVNTTLPMATMPSLRIASRITANACCPSPNFQQALRLAAVSLRHTGNANERALA
jgi:hypothetical protein